MSSKVETSYMLFAGVLTLSVALVMYLCSLGFVERGPLAVFLQMGIAGAIAYILAILILIYCCIELLTIFGAPRALHSIVPRGLTLLYLGMMVGDVVSACGFPAAYWVCWGAGVLGASTYIISRVTG